MSFITIKMNTKIQIINNIEKILKELGVDSPKVVLDMPVYTKLGDYTTNVAMFYARGLKENPLSLAEKIKSKLEESGIVGVSVAKPGFINFFFDKSFFAENIKEILEKKEKYGTAEIKNHTWVVEHTSPNPNKAMHIGHLRNNLTGMALYKIAEANGYKVICDAVDNNRGIAIAKLMWGYLKFARKDGTQNTDVLYWSEHKDEWLTPEESKKTPDRFVDDLYVLGSTDFDADKEVEKQVRLFVVDWENDKKIIRELWSIVLQYSYDGQKPTLERLQNKWDFVWHEHEHYKQGKEFVIEGLEKGVFNKTEDGAVITNLAKYNLTDTIVQKSDGTALYITQDLALTKLKIEKYKADELFWVIGPEQSLAMQQMFCVCEQLGIGKKEDFTHIAYGYVSISGQGKMSSRKGNTIFIDDLIDQVKDEIRIIMNEKKSGVDDFENVLEMLAVGAVKYEFLKVSRLQDISFDIKKSANIEGDSGPYLQYATVRANSILKKAQMSKMPFDTMTPGNWITTNLERYLERFPNVVERAGQEYAPSHIATYLIEIAGEFNSFYASHKIIDETDTTSPYRLALTQAFVFVMTRGLDLLGIKVPEQM